MPQGVHVLTFIKHHIFVNDLLGSGAAAFVPPWCSSQPFPKGYPCVELDSYRLSFWLLVFLDGFLELVERPENATLPIKPGQCGLVCACLS